MSQANNIEDCWRVARARKWIIGVVLSTVVSTVTANTNFEETHKLAEAGDSSAQMELARMYIGGRGIPQDYEMAATWALKAAEQGDATAQYTLALLSSIGKGVPKDEKKATIWYRKAAEQGHAGAQKGLGDAYNLGSGVEQDYEQAKVWYLKAAEQGDASASLSLSRIYESTYGGPKDEKQAMVWLHKAAEQGDAEAQHTLGLYYGFGHSHVPKDEKQAFMWYQKAAEQGHAESQGILGNLYELGRGIARDLTLAMVWYRKAAEQGNFYAKEKLDPSTPLEILTWRNGFTSTTKQAIGGAKLSASLGFSKGGKKRIYFKEHWSWRCDKSDSDDEVQNSTWVFNEQPVKMSIYCSGDGSRTLSATPYSDRGLRFVIDLFKKTSENVLVDFITDKFPMSAQGFTKEWSKTKDSVL